MKKISYSEALIAGTLLATAFYGIIRAFFFCCKKAFYGINRAFFFCCKNYKLKYMMYSIGFGFLIY